MNVCNGVFNVPVTVCDPVNTPPLISAVTLVEDDVPVKIYLVFRDVFDDRLTLKTVSLVFETANVTSFLNDR